MKTYIKCELTKEQIEKYINLKQRTIEDGITMLLHNQTIMHEQILQLLKNK